MSLYSGKVLWPHRYKHSKACFHQWIVFLITSCVCVIFVTSHSDNLMWNITSIPVRFGNTAELSCYISDNNNNCTQELLQWIGGQHYTSLCQNMRCLDGTKYHVTLKTACSYTLIISNFSIFDVNCDYSCFYGTHSYRRHLQLNNNEFVSVPRIKHQNVSSTGGFIRMKVSMNDVYPSPNCHALLAGKNITNSLLVITSKREYFYDVELQVNHSISHCNGNATIYCYLGKEEIIVLNEYIDACSEFPTSHPPGNSRFLGAQYAGVIAGVIAVVILVMSIGVYLLHNKNRNEHYEGGVYRVLIDKPSAPVGPMSIYNITDSSADIAWQEPTKDGGAPLEKYKIEYRLAYSSTWTVAAYVNSSTHMCSVNNLTEGQEYYFRVTAINSTGSGFPLQSVDLVTILYKPPAPERPTSPVDTSNTGSSDIARVAPKKDGGAPVETLKIEYQLVQFSKWTEAGNVDITISKFNFTYLTEGLENNSKVPNINRRGPRSQLESVDLVQLIDMQSAIDRFGIYDKTKLIKLIEGLKKTEKCFFARFMILRKNPTLIRRSLKDRIEDVSRSEKVEIDLRRCTIGKEDDVSNDRIHAPIVENENQKHEICKMKSSEGGFTKFSTQKSSSQMIENAYETRADQMNKIKNVCSSTNNCLAENKDRNKALSLILPPDLMSRVISTTSTLHNSSNVYASCGFWDVAGQKEFHATHQNFFTSSAIYMVIANIAADISTQDDMNHFADLNNIRGNVDVWFNYIHSHQTVNPPSNDLIDAPVIMVFLD